MVVDTSALMAIAFKEPEAEALFARIARAGTCRMSAGSLLEAGIVIMRRSKPRDVPDALMDLADLIRDLAIGVEPVTERQAREAINAYRRFGKGFHPAGLNFGDCFAYALAAETGEPLLFKGTDFAATDVAVA